MEVGMVRRIDIDAEMQQSYLDYAMSVIISRALPDARDGLKPVHRRILHAMHSMGLRHDSSFKKSARIVGEVLGKFHPHGDMAVYEAMARMAQDFSLRYPLIQGQGNFGSIDGDPPAAMRYTETRVDKLAMEMLADINMDTVDFEDNFDGSLQEPVVLPSAIPNLLINGSTGIAVGMATSIPPHNLSEVCDALVFMLQNWSRMDSIQLDTLMNFIKGPDFPTGGVIVSKDKGEGDALSAAYGTGRGKITVQARAHVEEMSRNRTRIIVTELPYQVNKSNLIERIADLARNGHLEGLTDLRDESDRQGMRIVLELTKNADPKKILSILYRRTPLQTTFSIILLALVDGQPRLLNLKQALKVYIKHRLEVIRRRSEYKLRRARERAHILAGYRVALANLDEIIQLIRNARDADQALTRLRKRYQLSEIQGRAILDMPLRRLSSLERKKIDIEYKESVKKIKFLETLIGSDKKMRAAVIEEITRIKETYGDRRRTLIAQISGDSSAPVLTASDLIPKKDCWITLTKNGLISRTLTRRAPRLAGHNSPALVIEGNSQDILYLFDKKGSAAAVAVHTLPECDDPSQGVPVNSATAFASNVQIMTGISLPGSIISDEDAEHYLFFGTRKGMLKKTSLELLPGPSARPFTVIKVNPDDQLEWVYLTGGSSEILLTNSSGLAIRFSEADVRAMGLVAAGVAGMRMAADATLVGMDLVDSRAELFLITSIGMAKRIPVSEFPKQGRNGKGVLVWKSGEKIEIVGAAVGQEDSRAIVRIVHGANKSVRFGDTKRRSRAAAGTALIELGETQQIAGITALISRPATDKKKTSRSSAPSGKKKKPEKKKNSPG